MSTDLDVWRWQCVVLARSARGGDAVAVNDGVISRRVGGVDAEAANDDGREHGEGEEGGFHGTGLSPGTSSLCYT